MQLGGIRENPEDVCTTIVIFRCVEVVTGDARNIDVRAIVDDYDIFLPGRDRQHRITCRIEVDGVIIAITIAINLTVLSRLEFDVLLFQSLFTEIALNFCVDGFERGVHIDVVIIDTERTIFHSAGIGDVLTLIDRAEVHANAVIVGMVAITAVACDFASHKRTDLVTRTCLANHIAGQIQIAAKGDLSDGVNCHYIVLDEQVVVAEDVVKVVGPAVLGVGFIRCFRHRAACSVCGNGAHAAKHHCKCCEDCE